MTKKISDIPKLDRPREKLQKKGAEALSDLELMAILVGKGTEGHDVMSVAKRILKILDSGDEKPNLKELQKIEGVGPAKATLIAAALEFARRRIRPEGLKISFPPDVLPLIQHLERGQRKGSSLPLTLAQNYRKGSSLPLTLIERGQERGQVCL